MTPIVLVIEDNKTEQYVLRQLLEKFGYEALVVASGEEAITALGVAKYAAILLDLTLPGIDGFECVKRIRRIEIESGRRTPVISLTARAEESVRDACLAAGMDDYLSKPFEPEELRKTLLRYVYDASQPNLKTLTSLSPEELEDVDLEISCPIDCVPDAPAD